MPSIACIPSVPAPGDATRLRDRARGAMLWLRRRRRDRRARRDPGSLRDQGALGPHRGLLLGRPSRRHGRHRVRHLLRPAGWPSTCSALTVAHVESAWHERIADRDEGPFRGAGFSERGTLENLRRGLAAPISAQHRHAWSDGLAMRAAPFGVYAAGRPPRRAPGGDRRPGRPGGGGHRRRRRWRPRGRRDGGRGTSVVGGGSPSYRGLVDRALPAPGGARRTHRRGNARSVPPRWSAGTRGRTWRPRRWGSGLAVSAARRRVHVRRCSRR